VQVNWLAGKYSSLDIQPRRICRRPTDVGDDTVIRCENHSHAFKAKVFVTAIECGTTLIVLANESDIRDARGGRRGLALRLQDTPSPMPNICKSTRREIRCRASDHARFTACLPCRQ